MKISTLATVEGETGEIISLWSVASKLVVGGWCPQGAAILSFHLLYFVCGTVTVSLDNVENGGWNCPGSSGPSSVSASSPKCSCGV